MALLFQICVPFHISLLVLFSVVSCRRGCGSVSSKQGETQFFVGVLNSTEGAWPWAVSVIIRQYSGTKSHVCTGSLIDNSHFITAAHCFERRNIGVNWELEDASLYTVKIGHAIRYHGEEYNISQIAIPESYTNQSSPRVYEDIAVVTLSRKVNTRLFSPICLPRSGQLRNLTEKEATKIGWGSVRNGGPLSVELLQMSAVPIISNSECESLYEEESWYDGTFRRGISSGIFCAGFLHASRRDICKGSDGGPLMIQEGNRWYIVGIHMFGILCGEPGFPRFYTRVSEYLDFINQNRN